MISFNPCAKSRLFLPEKSPVSGSGGGLDRRCGVVYARAARRGAAYQR
jgi:hypothetical protein